MRDDGFVTPDRDRIAASGPRQARVRHGVWILLCTTGMLLPNGCAPDRTSFAPGEVRAFRVPVTGSGSGRDSTLCLFSVPPGYSPDRSFPLLVALHGKGGSAPAFHDLWLTAARSCGYVLATPQGEERTEEGIGYGWGPDAERTVLRCIDVVLNKVNVDRSKVYLSGFSQGGWLTYALARAYPHAFAGIGPLGAGRELPDSSAAASLRRMQIYIGHGDEEPRLSEVRALAERLRSEGCRVQLTVYPHTGHGIPQPADSELTRILRFFGAGDGERKGAHVVHRKDGRR